MKRIIVMAAVAIAALTLAGSASAVPKPPRTACLQFGPANASILVIKPFGKAITSAGPTKIYALYGEYLDVAGGSRPLSGSGHMVGNIFHFGFTAASVFGFPGLPAFTWEGRYDVTTGIGAAEASYYGGGLAGSQSPTLGIVTVDCSTAPLPYGREGQGSSPLFTPWGSDSKE
jgi:hypothetical protein